MQILYFAWVRQKTGKGSETVDLPKGLETVSDLITWLKTRGEGYANAFEDLSAIRVAVNQTHQTLDASIKDATEIAFFPPVTGG